MTTALPPAAEGNGSGPPWSEPGFQRLFDIMPHAVLLSDPAGRIALANERAESLFAYTRAELLGSTIEMLVPLRYRPGHSGFRALFFAAPETRPMGTGRDLYALRKDGREVPVEIGLTPVPTAAGTFVLCSIVDITERRRADAHFRIAVEASPNAMVMTDRRGVILLVNSQTESMFGYPREELIGQPVEILVPERFRPTHPASRAAFLADPHARAMGAGRDLFALRRDGTEVPVEIGLNPIETNEGVMVLSAIIEITERKRAQDELARYARELERSNADLQEFAAVASHDLQEPLRKVGAFGELLRARAGSSLDAESLDYIDRMQ